MVSCKDKFTLTVLQNWPEHEGTGQGLPSSPEAGQELQSPQWEGCQFSPGVLQGSGCQRRNGFGWYVT